MANTLSFDKLSATQFEEFCFDLLHELKFVNIDWRKGTGKKTSPADRGRDIVCQEIRIDIDKSVHLETWFVDCKHFKKGIPPTELQNILSWAEAERPQIVLIVTSNFLSNPSKDYLENYLKNRKPPFKIKVWERPNIEKLASRKSRLLRKYSLINVPIRGERAIIQAEDELFNKVWYNRHQNLLFKVQKGVIKLVDIDEGQRNVCQRDIWEGALKAAKRVEKKYGLKNLGPWDDFEWGMVNGKLSALRWVLGEKWDMLDT